MSVAVKTFVSVFWVTTSLDLIDFRNTKDQTQSFEEWLEQKKVREKQLKDEKREAEQRKKYAEEDR